jgi:Rrf2 family iron-sulfur cluster assembly transcriptional regulator
LHLLQRVGRQIAAPATDGLRCADLVIEQGRPMRLNTKTRLAVNTMLDLALRDEAGPVVLASIAKRQQVSLSCIEQVFSLLRAAGLVRSTRGLGGGYSLGCDAASISVADIVAAIEAGSASAKAYQRRPTLADDFSQRLDAAMHGHMAAIALADLAEGQGSAGVTVEVRASRSGVAPRPVPRHIGGGAPNSVFELGTTRPTVR